MKVAALDLGTNTFLCLICEVENGNITKIYHDSVEMVRLGQGVADTKTFHQEALTRADWALAQFAKQIEHHQPQRVLAMATSAARDVSNGHELFVLGKKYHIPIEIIPGAKEAEITFSGSVSATSDQQRRLIIDIGGGSTELIVGTGKELEQGLSLNLGCVRLTEKYQLTTPTTHELVNQVSAVISSEMGLALRSLLGAGKGVDEILAVAGTPTEIARATLGGDFDAEKIEGLRLSVDELTAWKEKFMARTKEQIVQEFSIHEKRADVILVGCLLLIECMKAAQQSFVVVSTRGVRHGVALEVASR